MADGEVCADGLLCVAGSEIHLKAVGGVYFTLSYLSVSFFVSPLLSLSSFVVNTQQEGEMVA